MVWSSLGTKTPNFDWQEFEFPAVGDEAVRITQTYQPGEISFLNKLHLGEFYPNNDFRFLRTIYPSTLPQLYEFTVPPVLVAAGYTLRHFAVKHNAYGLVAEANWQITIEVWYPDAP